MIKKGKLNKILYLAALLLIIGFTISVISSNGLAEPKMFEEMVPMPDGVRLHTFVYLPDSEFWSPPYPAIVARTPYGVGEAGVLAGPDRPFMTALGKAAQDVPGPVLKGWKAIIARGYACVFQDTRGRFASEGMDRIYLDEALVLLR